MSTYFNYLTIEERAALSPEDFGDPDRRLFPILTQEDINLAPRRISFFPDFENIKLRLISIAKRKGFNLPEAWIVEESADKVADVATASAFSVSNNLSDGNDIAEFELDEDATKDTKDGEFILRTGKIFEAGQYKDKKFEISPEELCEAIADFKPVDLDLEHMPTILDGKLGRLEAVALGADGWSLIGTVRIPKWLDSQLGAAERKVSATWDRVTKKLTKLALVRNPRVKDAALMAAFMANELSDQLEGTTEGEFSKTVESLIEEHFASQTWDGKRLMQDMHDMAARAGAVCIESEKKFNEAKSAGFVSSDEAKVIQQLHDASLRGGAKCRFIEERSGDSPSYYTLEENNIMTIDDVKKFFKGLPDDEALEIKTEISPEDKKAAELSAREEAVKAAELALAEKEAALTAKADTPAAEDKADDTTDEVANSGPSERELELEAMVDELRQKDVKREAEKFADTEIKAGRAFPAERETLVALFTQSSVDDSAGAAKISFNSGDEVVEGTRVDALKALYAVRKPHNLTYEEVGDVNANVLVATYGDEEDYLGEAETQAKEYAAKRNKIAAKK